MFNPLNCEKCGRELEADDAISIIEGVCVSCRDVAGSMAQPLRVDQMMAEAANALGTIPPREPEPYQESPILQRSPALESVSDKDGPTSLVGRAPPASPDQPDQDSIPPIRSTKSFDTNSVLTVIDTPPSNQPSRSTSEAASPRKMHDLHPPTPPFEAAPIVRVRRRRRDLMVGIVVGLFVTAAVTVYLLRDRSEPDPMIFASEKESRPTLTLGISPPSASVKLNGQALEPMDSFGKVNLTLPAGNLDEQWLDIYAAGYRSERRPLSFFKGTSEAFIELVRRPYELILETNPARAEVWIDNQRRGTTPLSVEIETDRVAHLVIRHEGYREWSGVVKPPEQGDELAMNLDLESAGPMVSIISDPPGAMITIDGKSMGTAPLSLELDPSYLGEEVEFEAYADGYDVIRKRQTMPKAGGGQAEILKLALSPAMSRFVIQTEPPGGQVMIGDQNYGIAPVTLTFEPEQTGKVVMIEASLGGDYYGRESLIIPPAGQKVPFKIHLDFSAQRIVFIVAWPKGIGPERYVSRDQLTRQIQRLQSSQQFSIIAATDNGQDVWPGSAQPYELASSEQKIRAYDMVWSIRPTDRISVDQLLEASIGLRPTIVWLYLECELDDAALDRFEELTEGAPFSVNVVRASVGSEVARLDRWTARHHGKLNIVGQTQTSIAVVGEDSEPEWP